MVLSLSANVLWFEMAKQTHWQHNSSPFLRSYSYQGPPNLPIVITNGQCSVFNLLDPWTLSDHRGPSPLSKALFRLSSVTPFSPVLS